MNYWNEIYTLLILALAVACIAWTVTHEEIFREPREYCAKRAKTGQSLLTRKFFYLFTCEYCFSHYVALIFIIITRFTLIVDDWRGYLISFFAVVAVANLYMSLFGLLRQNLKTEKMEANIKQEELKEIKKDDPGAENEEP